MKLNKMIRYTFLCASFLCLASCEKENLCTGEGIPPAIADVFTKMYTSYELVNYNYMPGGYYQIDFIDNQGNEATAWFGNKEWKLTHTKLSAVHQLPHLVSEAFRSSAYGNEAVTGIDQTDRYNMEKSLYTIHFSKGGSKYDLYIHESGRILDLHFDNPNDPYWWFETDQGLDAYIDYKYNGAVKLGITSNLSHALEYFILHNNILKKVFASNSNTWRATSYDIDPAGIPGYATEYIAQNYREYTILNYGYKETGVGFYNENTHEFDDWNQGHYYEFTLKKGEREITISIPVVD